MASIQQVYKITARQHNNTMLKHAVYETAANTLRVAAVSTCTFPITQATPTHACITPDARTGVQAVV